MHKPDPKLGPDQQEKRSLVLLEPEDFHRWLGATVSDAKALMKLMSLEALIAAPFLTAQSGSENAASK